MVKIRDLPKWKTIWDENTQKWYILTPVARDLIETAFYFPEQSERFVQLETATARNGEGTGSYEEVEVSALTKHFS